MKKESLVDESDLASFKSHKYLKWDCTKINMAIDDASLPILSIKRVLSIIGFRCLYNGIYCCIICCYYFRYREWYLYHYFHLDTWQNEGIL